MPEAGAIPVDKRTAHALNRLAFGPRPGDAHLINARGVERYVQEQLRPEELALPDILLHRLGELRTLRMSPVALFEAYGIPIIKIKGNLEAQKVARMRSRVIFEDAVEARFWRAVESPAQLLEVMTAFWFNDRAKLAPAFEAIETESRCLPDEEGARGLPAGAGLDAETIIGDVEGNLWAPSCAG